MSAVFDIGPLTWVKSEIDSSLERARKALQAYVADPTAGAQIKACRANLHQASGAVQIVGLDGVTRFFEETEALVGELEAGHADVAAASDAIERAVSAIGRYLTELLDGKPDQPLRLFPVFRDLLQARGAPAPVEADLFFPDLTLTPPPRDAPATRLPKGELEAFAKAQRARYQRGFLRWLRAETDAQAVADMRGAVDAIEETQTVPAQRAFWWAAGAFLDALCCGDLPADAAVRQVCTRIEQQIRRMGEGSRAVAGRLQREVLYWIARAGDKPASARAAAAQQAFALRGVLPAAQAPEDVTQRVSVAQALREAAAAAKDAWNRYAAGTATSLGPFLRHAQAIEAQAALLGNAALGTLTRDLAACAAALETAPAKMSEAAALEVATALLIVENAAAHYRDLGADFTAQAGAMSARLGAVALGRETPGDLPGGQLIDELTRRAQDRRAMSSALSEMQGNLQRIEQALDAYFRDPARAAELSALDGVLRQVTGALGMLGEDEARAALERCAERIRAFAQAGARPALAEFEEVAQTLSGLGFYIEALKHGKADFAAAMRPVQPPAPPAAPDPADLTASVEADIVAHKRETQALFAALQASPGDEGIRTELKEKLQSIRDDAEFVADAALGEHAAAALQQLGAAAGPDDTQGLARALDAITPPPEAPSEQAARLMDASEEAVDQELLAIFLEEAATVLDTIAGNLEALQAPPSAGEALTTIRRAFHTLKGSGRMVGLARLGEAAWAVEQVMNLWLQEERAVTPALVALIRDTHVAFADWVRKLNAGEAQPEPAAIIASAERVRAGEPAPAAAPAEPAAVMIGRSQLSPSLYAVFVNEARLHLDALEREIAAVAAGAGVSEEFLRVAHTLAGICGTVQLGAMRALGLSLENVLTHWRGQGLAPDAEMQAGVARAVAALRGMYEAVLARQAPGPRADLAAALDALAARPAPAAAAPPPAPGAEPVAPEPVAPELADDELDAERRRQRLEDEVDAQLLPVFLEEAGELAPQVGALLRAWRGEPAQLEHARALQRALHTLKGGARMAGAMGLGEVAHHMETRVEHAIAAERAPETLFDELDGSCDRIGALLEALAPSAPQAAGAPPAPADAPPAPAEAAGSPRAVMRVRAETLEKLVNQAGEVSIARSRIDAEMRAMKAALGELVENVARLRHQLREIEIQAESQMQARSRDVEHKHESFDPLEFDRFTQFQELTRLMAESVSDVGTVQQSIAKIVDNAENALGAQARMNRELQQDLMRVRMVPAGTLTDRLHRVVRQTAKELGKRAILDLAGESVEVDRSVLERMMGPLEHLLRNALTHGIEAPPARAAAGKPESGEIRLHVRQEGQDVTLSLSDDGAGLDLARIRERAMARGLLKAGEAPAERVLVDMIFVPGFSTAEHVTEVAGRGVGMDVVKNEVANLGGRIEVSTAPGKGTTFLIRLPLTTAVTQAVLVKSGARTCALPSVMVEQLQQLRPAQLEKARAAGAVEWAGRRFPLAYLPELLNEPGAEAAPRKYHPVLLLRAGAESVALLVDEMIGNQEVVVKNIGPQLARVPGVTGATVLGTGEIVLILNPVALAARPRAQAAPAAAAAAPAPAPARPCVMVVDDSLTVRKITGRMLAREGYEVLVAKDGVEALELLADSVPDVMLVDIEMPRMDGFELTRNVRGDARLKAVPIIIISSRSADKHQAYAAELGVNAFLGKPYQEEELLGRIAGFTGR